MNEPKKLVGPLDLTSPFVRNWDMLTLCLLLFTASVTPFETAYFIINRRFVEAPTDYVHVDLLFLINRFVDLIFFSDIFIQCRTPFRNETTGRLVLDIKVISSR
jgi:hypothetical protein